jgi:hypothetical protein
LRRNAGGDWLRRLGDRCGCSLRQNLRCRGHCSWCLRAGLHEVLRDLLRGCLRCGTHRLRRWITAPKIIQRIQRLLAFWWCTIGLSRCKELRIRRKIGLRLHCSGWLNRWLCDGNRCGLHGLLRRDEFCRYFIRTSSQDSPRPQRNRPAAANWLLLPGEKRPVGALVNQQECATLKHNTRMYG